MDVSIHRNRDMGLTAQHDNEDVISVPQWPTQPQALRSRKRDWIAHGIWILVVVPYVILALYALGGQSKTVSQRSWDRIQTAIKVAVTIFPIAFAAIISRMLRQISQWQLERSASVGSLEQLRRSSTVFGTLSILFVLRSLNWMGLGLLLLWTLSPLGAQSALRILSADLRQHNASLNLAYLDLAQTSQRLQQPVIERQNDLADQLFVSNILAPNDTRLSSMDAWGNVKIPLLLSDDNNNNNNNNTDWTPVPNDVDVVYSSLLGIPILGLPLGANSSFTLATTYMRVACFQLATTTHARQLQPSVMNRNGVPLLLSIPEDSIGMPPDAPTSDPIIRWSAPNYAETGGDIYTTANCSLTQIPVEAEVRCLSSSSSSSSSSSQQQQTNCSVTAMRQTQLSPSIPPLLQFFTPFGAAMMNSTPEGHPYSPSLEDHYLNGIDHFNDTSMNAIPALSNISRPVFSQRLTQLVNTYYTARVGYEMIMAQAHAPTPQDLNTTTYSTAVIAWTTAVATHDNPGPTVVAHWPWVGVFLVAVVVLVGAVVVAPVVQAKTLTPDILGYVSSLTREGNPEVRLPSPGRG
ncbi:hypothetical protein FE257_007640 [Aspergillus nanangensis]|uniref:Uncharacterized protein n=1 Tax=Aspergillus nanangensis TaxID=2582783 RepID=A0AAD4GTZ5_ASPNN|nr:hypothetical protein FE257_007640 [Aspergillus nanangensis]